MGVLVTKDGVKITRTVEMCRAYCDVIGVERNARGGYDLEYGDAGSDIDYDSMEQVKLLGQPVYLDADGEEYLESDLRLVEADEFGQPLAKCDNCDWTGPESQLNEIVDFDQRVAPGEPIPVGECSECGCLAHFIESDEKLIDEPVHVPGLNEALAPEWPVPVKGDA